MKKLKKYYVIIFVMIMITTISFSASYAIFSNTKEEHGKLNIVAGTLNYKIESSSLDSDSVTVPANTSKEIKIKLTSLNEVSSKYELYYVLDKTNDKVSVGYSKDTKDNVVGTIDANKNKIITIVIRNDSDTSSKITFKVLGGLVNNELALKDGNSLNKELALCNYEKGYVWNFDYTGGEQEFVTPCSGNYKLETWGAQGTSHLGTGGKTNGGYGGYSDGKVSLKKGTILFINVGQNCSNNGEKKVAYNGGGSGDMPGGGATHIALRSGILSSLENYLNDILIASGGGGGEDADPNWETTTSTIVSGSGGGFKGVNASFRPGYGGTQTEGGTGYSNGTFGKGGNSSNANDSAGGGGGGFYGGGSGIDGNWSSGGGGSGYIGNSLLTNKAMYCYNCEESNEESTKTISTTCNEETSTSYCAKKGNGYARITYLGN